MPLSWNEIRKRAIEFSQEFKDATRENAETQTFYNELFNVFGISRRRVATFEEPVKKLGNKDGRIDLFWKGVLLAEQKSTGRNLESAHEQALDYFPNLKEEELPRYLLCSDFQKFDLYDLEEDTKHSFTLKQLHKNVEHFGFIAGYRKREFKDQDPANIKASELMGKLHDQLKEIGYEGEDLELLLVRLLFALFADDTAIFEKNTFLDYIELRTNEDGSDLGAQIALFFQTLNTPVEKRVKTLDEDLANFPYVNGDLFGQTIRIASFNSDMRKSLIEACYFDWSKISPAIFGSLFQSVMDKEKRRGIGAHYTTEQNIMKIIKPLFMDDLYEEFNRIKSNSKRLELFHEKLGKLMFLDPACGCGNFLILAYRELRELELLILKELNKSGQMATDINQICWVDVDQFYGIEMEEFPARIAEVALWLVDHQMNMKLSEEFGQYYVRIPLQKSANITNDNALRIDWKKVIEPKNLDYILGNPPFRGKKEQSDEQKGEMRNIFTGVKGSGVLDYVSAWYLKASEYIQNTPIRVAFVSTNSITQGEQVGILWQELLTRYRIKIHFAHRTFAWSSEAKGKAAVFCVIIGFANFNIKEKLLYNYDTPKSDAHEIKVRNINPYLVDTDDVVILKRGKPICNIRAINYGSIAIDEGNLILEDDEKDNLLAKEPLAKKYIRPYTGSREFLNRETRWCLWLEGISPSNLRSLPFVLKRVEANKVFRLKSERETTVELAKFPALFGENRQPASDYLLIPKVSSMKREYIPIGYCKKNMIANGSSLIMPDADFFCFGVIGSTMHNSWMRYVAGRMKSDYQYSSQIVYNNFPWPLKPTKPQVKDIEAKSQAVLSAREEFPDSSLADLYDPLTMPPALLKAHQALDKAVDKAYRPTPFTSERQRIAYLFELYRKYTNPLLAKKKTVRRKV